MVEERAFGGAGFPEDIVDTDGMIGARCKKLECRSKNLVSLANGRIHVLNNTDRLVGLSSSWLSWPRP